MKILILGAGQVGRTAADHLSREEANEVTVVDVNEDTLRSVQDRFDVRTVAGNAAHPNVLAPGKRTLRRRNSRKKSRAPWPSKSSIPTSSSISLYHFEVAKMSRTKVLEASSVITSLAARRARLDEDIVFTLHGTSSSPFVVSHGGWSSCSSIQAENDLLPVIKSPVCMISTELKTGSFLS